MHRIFAQTEEFNQDLSNWDTSSVRDMSYAFWNASAFGGGGIENWDMTVVTDASEMFWNARLFNAPIGSWNVGRVQRFTGTFQSAHSFNQPLPWNVESAEHMDFMFEDAFQFNQNIRNWNVRRVESMENMFGNATSFSQNLCSWGTRVDFDVETSQMFGNTACPYTISPDLLSTPSGPWCEYCGTAEPTVGPTAAPNTAPPTTTFAPTGPTVAPFTVETIPAGAYTATGKVLATIFVCLSTGFLLAV